MADTKEIKDLIDEFVALDLKQVSLSEGEKDALRGCINRMTDLTLKLLLSPLNKATILKEMEYEKNILLSIRALVQVRAYELVVKKIRSVLFKATDALLFLVDF